MTDITYLNLLTARTPEQLNTLMADFQRTGDLVEAMLDDSLPYDDVLSRCVDEQLGSHALIHLFSRAGLEKQTQGIAPGSQEEHVVRVVGNLMQSPQMTGPCLDHLFSRYGEWSESVRCDVANILATTFPKSLTNALDVSQSQVAAPVDDIRRFLKDDLFGGLSAMGREQVAKTAFEEKKLSALHNLTQWAECVRPSSRNTRDASARHDEKMP